MNRKAYNYNFNELEKLYKQYREYFVLFIACLILLIFFVIMFFLNLSANNIPWLILFFSLIAFMLAYDYKRMKDHSLSQINAIESKIKIYMKSQFFIEDKVSYKGNLYTITSIYSNSVILNTGISVDVSEIRLVS